MQKKSKLATLHSGAGWPVYCSHPHSRTPTTYVNLQGTLKTNHFGAFKEREKKVSHCHGLRRKKVGRDFYFIFKDGYFRV